MNRLLIRLEQNINSIVDALFKNPPFPPYAFNLADVSPSTSVKPSKQYGSRVEELFGVDLGILWGMPTHKTPRPTKFRKRYGVFKLWRPKVNLVTCQHCGSWHEVHTICGDCYESVKKETEIIKKLYVKNGSPPTEETIVLYNNEKLPEGEFWNGKRIVELKKDRPSWFSNDLKKRWNKLISSEKIGRWPTDSGPKTAS